MSYSFLSDAFPSWKEFGASGAAASCSGLYETFEGAQDLQMPKPPANPPSMKQRSRDSHHVDVETDTDLLSESFTDYNLPTKPTPGQPQPFDSTMFSDDYYKLLANDWKTDVASYQAQARGPFGPKDYSEEPQLTAATTSEGCMSVAKHLDHCKDCRKRLEDIFSRLLGGGSASKKRMVSPSGSIFDSMKDVLILLAIGLFVIFVLDGFVRLGRYLKT